MMNNDNQVSNYDIGIMKKNISKLMKDKGITQSQLAEIIGASQSRVSKILNLETSDCFTIQQLFAIAQTLHVSTDSILGIKAIEQPETTQEISLADICAKLFELDNLASISFGACKNGQYEEPQNPYEDPIALESPCIFFKNKSITDFIAEWNEIKKINVQSISVKKSLYTNWKNGTIAENKSRLAKYDFKEKRLYQKELAKSYLSDYGYYSYGLPFLLPDDEDLLTEYVRSGDYILDFDEDSQKKLLNWLGHITHESI